MANRREGRETDWSGHDYYVNNRIIIRKPDILNNFVKTESDT